MQRLAKRAVQAQRQAARRAQQHNKQNDVDLGLRSRRALRSGVEEIRRNLKDARKARQEDWELGPLAPKRDLGFNEYGAVAEAVRKDWTQYGVYKTHPKVLMQRTAWAGGVKQLNLAPGDRVVIQDGPDAGKIDRIKDIQPQAGTVTLENHHKAFSTGSLGNPGQPIPMPLSIGSIRLVYPITNPETGVTRDTVINQLKAVPPNMQSPHMTLDRWTYGNKWDRVVPGINVVIPWPETRAPEFETTAADTVREQLEDRTFYYNLLSPPMPESVVDELRNKYSRFRTRHEPWYLAKKEAEAAAKKGRHEALNSMRTPLAEFHERQREMRAERGEPQLTDEMLEKIGELMARKKAAALADAGLSEVPPAPSPTQPTP
ncbi:54S ribosomal protein L40 [Escovopsis weberi]|uniref:54S ribosomal protein L40 n=1 Tax=Escovopsis weberi TaxID=150374 RepID=A0A0M8MSR7_ESCWE|nr:54S ribosomal protein L40 [Escovopsis weberi]